MSKRTDDLTQIIVSRYQQLFIKKYNTEHEIIGLQAEYDSFDELSGRGSMNNQLEIQHILGRRLGGIEECRAWLAEINSEIENSSRIISRMVGEDLVQLFVHDITKMTDCDKKIDASKREKKALDDESDTYDDDYDALVDQIEALNKESVQWSKANQANRGNLFLKLSED